MTKKIQHPIDEAIELKDLRNAAIGASLAGAAMLSTQHSPEPAPVKQAVSYTSEQVEPAAKEAMYLALTIWGEARNHGEDGMNAVGHVIKNRVEADKRMFGGDTYKGVVLKRKQFSCWNPGDTNYPKIKDISGYLATVGKNSPDAKRWEEAKKIAIGIVMGKSRDVSKGALFYHTTGVKPSWAEHMHKVGTYASHIFYKSEENPQNA